MTFMYFTEDGAHVADRITLVLSIRLADGPTSGWGPTRSGGCEAWVRRSGVCVRCSVPFMVQHLFFLFSFLSSSFSFPPPPP